jgi:hypothetical protein
MQEKILWDGSLAYTGVKVVEVTHLSDDPENAPHACTRRLEGAA